MIRDRNIDWLRKRVFIPATQFTGIQQKAFTPILTMTDGSSRASYSVADVLGADEVADSETVDVAEASIPATNADYICAKADFTTHTAAPTVAASPDIARNVVVYVRNESGGALDMFEGIMTITVTGTYQGSAQTEGITITCGAGNKSVADNFFRLKRGVKPFDTVTTLAVANGAAGTLNMGIGLGNLMGLPLPPDTPAEADIFKVTVSAAPYTITSNYSVANDTFDVSGASDTADGLDFNINYKVDYDGAAGTIAAHAVDTLLISAGTGNPALAQVSTFGLMGLKCTAAGNDIRHVFPAPYDMDPNYEIGFSVVWTSGSSTVADTIDWKVLLGWKAIGAALAAPATALDTAVAQDTVAGAYYNQRTARGIADADFLTRAQIEAGGFLEILVEMDAFAVGLTEDKFLLGVEVDYMPRMCRGRGRTTDAPLTFA